MASVLLIGFGPIGQAVARRVLEDPGLELVGVVDIRPEWVGKDAGEIVGGEPIGVQVYGEIARAPRATLALHHTRSHLPDVLPDLLLLIERGMHVVSTTEELAYPWAHHPEASRHLDEVARRKGVSVVGVGVNPGFVMDVLPAFLARSSLHIQRVEVFRFQEARYRREPLQRKIGAGLMPEEFEARREELGHVGLVESAHLLARLLGFSLTRVEENLAPLVAERYECTRFVTIEPGQVRGIRQVVRGFEGLHERVVLHLEMAVGIPSPRDEIRVDGEPSFTVRVEGGMPGDEVTANLAVQAARRIHALPAGLRHAGEVLL